MKWELIYVSVIPRSLGRAQTLDFTGIWMLISLNGVPTICLRGDFAGGSSCTRIRRPWLVFLCELALKGENRPFSRRIYPSNQGGGTTLSTRLYWFWVYSYKDVFEEMLDFPNLILSYHNFQKHLKMYWKSCQASLNQTWLHWWLIRSRMC